MKSLILILTTIIFILFESCGEGKIITQKDYDLGMEKTVTVGSTMLSYISGTTNMFDPNLLAEGTRDELAYSGKSGNTIKIDYRQYYNNNNGWYIEDGFPQHLEYDLSISDLITCRNFQIKILSSNNNEIKFIVIKD
jgi:hypothetical protein